MGNSTPQSGIRFDARDYEVQKRTQIQAEIRSAENRMSQVLQYYEGRKSPENNRDYGKLVTAKYYLGGSYSPYDAGLNLLARLPGVKDWVTQLLFFGGVAASMELSTGSNGSMCYKTTFSCPIVVANAISRELGKLKSTANFNKAFSAVPLRFRPYATALALPATGLFVLNASKWNLSDKTYGADGRKKV